MYNCSCVVRDGRRVAYFGSELEAEMYIKLMRQEFAHLNVVWNIDWCYVDGLQF